jgi:NitT/TauT family transport system ATP-binding protein
MAEMTITDGRLVEALPAGNRNENALTFDHVSMTFPNGTAALDDVTLDVRRGEFVTIVGPSGCGKSTLLRLAASLERPTAGRVDVHDDDLAYVFQDPTLLPWRNVQGNVELPGQIRKIPRQQRRDAAADAIRLAGLAGFEGHLPRQLSGGMRMRVSLARALSLRPRIFLFDEPFGALDEITRERLNDELLRLFQQERFAGLFVTHSVAEAVFLSTRVIVMTNRPGRIAADIEIPFAYPRLPELRFAPEFGERAGLVSAMLREATL